MSDSDGRTIYKWRKSDSSEVWATTSPEAGAIIVDQITEKALRIKQNKKTPGHIRRIPITFDATANDPDKITYFDYTVPDLSNGIDLVGADFLLKGATDGDEIACAKVIIRGVGSVGANAPAAQADIDIQSALGKLVPTLQEGILDEGFYMTFGTDATTDAGLNAETETELEEHEIKRIGAESDIGGGFGQATITMFSNFSAQVDAGLNVNLVLSFIPSSSPIEIHEGEKVTIGQETFDGANLPAGAIIRLGYKNTGPSDYRVRGSLMALY